MRRPKRIVICRRASDFDSEVVAWLRGGPLGVDTETTGLDWWQKNGKRDLVGAVCLAASETAVFVYRDALASVFRYLSDQVKARRPLVFHNAKFDMHMLRETSGLHIDYPVFDTKIESFMIDNRGATAYTGKGHGKKWQDHQLKSLASVFFDPDARDFEKQMMADIRARGGKHKGDWLLGDEKWFAEYGAMDPWYTLQLHNLFLPMIDGWIQPSDDEWEYPSLRSLYDTERWLQLALRDMEERGIICDAEFLHTWGLDLKQKLDEQLHKLVKLAGREINWNSTPQLRELLYSKRGQGGLGIKPLKYTPSGGASTDQATLLEIPHEIGPELVRYRELFKQYSSYAVSLPDWIDDFGAIHPTINQTGAETGRMSCSDPNLQQQTRTSGVRAAYKPRKGLVLRFADYSQVEMRFAGHFSNEPALIKGFNEDPDFDMHSATAQLLYGHPPVDGTQQRKFAKILNFTKIFGGGENKITEQLVSLLEAKEAREGLRELGILDLEPGLTPWRALAQQLVMRMNQRLPELVRAIKTEAKTLEHRGFVMNAFGRHRYIDTEKSYKAFNTKVQGTAGDQAKKGLVELYKELQVRDGRIALLLQIHDENVYESDGDPKTDKMALELMQNLDTFTVPIIADMSGSAESWQAKTKVKV